MESILSEIVGGIVGILGTVSGVLFGAHAYEWYVDRNGKPYSSSQQLFLSLIFGALGGLTATVSLVIVITIFF